MIFVVVLVLSACPLQGSYKKVKYAKCRFCGESREAGLNDTDTAVN